ncbi:MULTISPECIES: relaxase domain-containing protein [unclassified Streptomyces]
MSRPPPPSRARSRRRPAWLEEPVTESRWTVSGKQRARVEVGLIVAFFRHYECRATEPKPPLHAHACRSGLGDRKKGERGTSAPRVGRPELGMSAPDAVSVTCLRSSRVRNSPDHHDGYAVLRNAAWLRALATVAESQLRWCPRWGRV